MNFKKMDAWEKWFSGVMLVLILAVVALGFRFAPHGVPFWEFTLNDVLRLLVSLAVVGVLIERATEVVIAVLRDAGRRKLEALARTAKACGGTADVKDAAGNTKAWTREELDSAVRDYKSMTAKQALTFSFFLGLLVSAVGFRSIAFLSDATVLHDLGPWQWRFFAWADIFITGALIGGGSKGIHTVMEAVIGFFDVLRNRQIQEKLKTP